MGRAVGIDLGTTYTAVAVVDEFGKATVLKNGDGHPTTPSVVYIDHPHYVVGDVALQSTLTEPERIVQFAKRSMGIPDHRITVEGRSLSPEFISSIILRKVVQDAAHELGEDIESAVITVPAYFSKAQRQATYEAGQLAGINILRIINEPTAAALSYGVAKTTALQAANPSLALVEKNDELQAPALQNGQVGQDTEASTNDLEGEEQAEPQPKYILVYDLGGGTFDVTILAMLPDSLEVVAIGGESHLGGKDWDDCIMNFVEAQFAAQYGVALNPDASMEAELRLKAEQAKRQLSQRPNAIITFKTKVSLPAENGQGVKESIIPVRIELSRAQFEAISIDLLRRTQLCLENVMSQARLDWGNLDEILCVGGSSKMPMVREMLLKLAGRAPLLHDPDECIAKGAAIQAAMLVKEGEVAPVSITHVLPHTLGVATIHNEVISVEPVVPALTPLPCASAREGFTSTMDYQTQVSVLIYEGESRDPNAYSNGPIGVFHLDIRPARPRGVPKIRVEFRCDENGRIIALARDKDTGKESRACILLGSARTTEEMSAESSWMSEAVVA